ncbi:MAG: porin family protein [Acidobacteria bacterium]|nr:porin family protein [Acidobacteriota bacterium]MCI0720162.1 porin family protein [Acidobacteriota bacterium]
MRSKILLAALLLMPGAAWAETFGTRYEVFGTVGGLKAYDDEGSIGTGTAASGGFGYRATPKLGFEIEVSRTPHLRDIAGGTLRFEGTGVFTTGSLLYHFSESRAQPYVLGGIGHLHYRREFHFLFIGTSDTANGFAYNFGGGVKIFLNRRFSARPEFRILVGEARNNQAVEPPFSVFRGSIGLAYHW